MSGWGTSKLVVLGLAGMLVVASLLEWITVSGGSSTGIDSTYGLIVLATGVVIAASTVYGFFGDDEAWAHVFGGILTYAMMYLYYDGLFPQEEPPYTTAHLPDGTVGPSTTMEFGMGMLLAGVAGAGLFLVGVIGLIYEIKSE